MNSKGPPSKHNDKNSGIKCYLLCAYFYACIIKTLLTYIIFDNNI